MICKYRRLHFEYTSSIFHGVRALFHDARGALFHDVRGAIFLHGAVGNGERVVVDDDGNSDEVVDGDTHAAGVCDVPVVDDDTRVVVVCDGVLHGDALRGDVRIRKAADLGSRYISRQPRRGRCRRSTSAKL